MLDQCVELRVHHAAAHQRRDQRDMLVVAHLRVEVGDGQSRLLQMPDQHIPHRPRRGDRHGDRHAIRRLHRAARDRDAVDRIDQRSQRRIGEQHHTGQQRRLGDHVRPRDRSHRRRTPERRRGVEPADVHPLLHDHARTEEADPRHDIGDHPDRLDVPAQPLPQIDERRRSDRDERVCAQARGPLPILPLRPDRGAEHEGGEIADDRVEERPQMKGGDEVHGVAP
ncbi:hypothetical protein WR25_25824 [Diploscapter pachys]|uniref:Uncharacterized protein n=1 Tax=Diploscapter pachys TaxID=2018661 RepID=A0A2A2K630_9BILA|nr:hypothetical protein WR25_25824 [Diploscapter pachys]